MDRLLRLLAGGTLLTLVGITLLALPDPTALSRDLNLQPLQQDALIATGVLLASATGLLTLLLTAQRRQRLWFVAFLLLLLVSVYSPLLIYWEAEHREQLIESDGFFLLHLSEHVLAPAVLALVALGYSVWQGIAAAWFRSGQDQTAQIEHSRLDRPNVAD